MASRSQKKQTPKPKPKSKPILTAENLEIVGELGTSDRVLVAGSPKDGKTTWALMLIAHIDPPRSVILNPGAEKRYYEIFGEARHDIDTSFPHVQHVAPPIYRDKRDYDRIWWPIAEEGNVYLLDDELSVVATENRYGDGLTYLTQQGRRRNCGAIHITQKLHRIPSFAFDLADHIFIGHVQGRDLKRLEEDTQRDWAHLIQNRKQYQFAWWSKNVGGEPRYIN